MICLFRTDSSVVIGTGHVMRCLTLAKALRDLDVECIFICRDHVGSLIEKIRQDGFGCIALEIPTEIREMHDKHKPVLAHADWLGASWQIDAQETIHALARFRFDWLVVDHYALDKRWEEMLRPYAKKVIVIDDLADRHHDCDLLLDQNLVANFETRYQNLLPEHCIKLLCPKYALLRSEFNALRPASLARRRIPELNRLLVFLGGIDQENETSKVVAGIKQANRKWQYIDIVVGQSFPAIKTLKRDLTDFPSATLHVQTLNMARLMAAADLAITAGGSVTWEKCALGLPSLVAIQGDNQQPIATKMHECGAQITLGLASELTPATYAHSLDTVRLDELTAMTQSAAAICDGSGIASVLKFMGIQA